MVVFIGGYVKLLQAVLGAGPLRVAKWFLTSFHFQGPYTLRPRMTRTRITTTAMTKRA